LAIKLENWPNSEIDKEGIKEEQFPMESCKKDKVLTKKEKDFPGSKV
jgi:hypothetical protein